MSPAFNSSSSITAPAAGRSAGRGLASPWSHVVRGEADAATNVPSLYLRPELVDRSLPSGIAPDSSSSSSSSMASLRQAEVASEEQGRGGNAAGKKAWNVLSNGDSEGGAVMGATWPELSESAKSFAKPTSSESSVVVPDGSDTAHEVPLMAPPKTTSNNPNPNSDPSPAVPARQKSIPKSNSIKRSGSGSGSGSQVNGSPLSSHQQSPTPEITPIALEEGSGSSPNGPSKGSNWDQNRDGGLTTQHHGEDDHRGGFNRNRRGNTSGGGGFHRGGVAWNSPRGFSNRDLRMPMSMPLVQQRGYSRPFVQPPPPPPAPFMGMPPHVRPIVAPMGYPDVPPHVYYMPAPPPIDPLRNVPFIPHQTPQAIASTVYIAPVEHLRGVILKQIEYYFSFENLLKDTYLRQKMDDQGWVPVSLIAGFNRVKQLTNDIPFILESLRGSTVVEIEDENIRRRNDWMNWILPSIPHQHGIVSRPQYSLTSGDDLILDHVQNLGLSESGSGSHLNNTSRPIGMGLNRTVSENLNTLRRDGASANAIDKVPNSAGSIVS